MTEPQVLSVHEAAEALGVSMQRVRQMLHVGQLAARRSSAGWLIQADSVVGRARNLHRGRPAEPQTAWAAIGLLAAAAELASRKAPDGPVPMAPVVADRKLRHRVLLMLAAMPDPVADEAPWRRLLSSRGQVRRLWIHPGMLERLAADPKVSNSGLRAAAAGTDGLAGGPDRLELYVGAGDADALIRRYRMRDDPHGQVKLVIVPASVPAELSPIPNSLVSAPAASADLLEEDDARARHAAIEQLQFSQRALHAVGWLDRATATLAKKQEGVQGAANRSLPSSEVAPKGHLASYEEPGHRKNQRAMAGNAAIEATAGHGATSAVS